MFREFNYANVCRDACYKANKTERLEVCQLPRPLYEIHKIIYLPASVKFFKDKMKNLETDESCFQLLFQEKDNKLRKFLMSYLMASDESDFNSLHAWTTIFRIFNMNFTKFENCCYKFLY